MEAVQKTTASSQVPESREARARKHDTLDKIAKLTLRIAAIERERNSQLFSKKHEFHSNFATLEDSEMRFNQQRKAEKQDLKQQINKIDTNVDGFKCFLVEVKPGSGFVEKLKVAMEEIEASIVIFKEKQREIYEDLIQDEMTLTQEVTAFEKKIESWLVAQPQETHIVTAANRVQSNSPSMPPAVMAFERFLQQTGRRQGGWDDFDHQTFLRIRHTHNGNPVFIEVAASELPTKTVDEILHHEKWYTEYCTLLQSKKLAIEAWRVEKQSLKATAVLTVPGEDEVETQSKKKKQDIIKLEKEERYAKLSAWKAQKQLKQIEAEEQRLKLELERKKEIGKEQKRRALLKSSVEEYIKHREEENNLQKEKDKVEEEERIKTRKLANVEVRRFRNRDLKAATDRKQKKLEEEKERLEQEKRLERLKQKVEVNVTHDPSRLFKATAVWVERKKSGHGSGMGGATLVMPRRAVPSWRQGV